MTLSGPLYAQDSVRRFGYWETLIQDLARIPGVQGVGVSNWIPLGMTGAGFIDIAGRERVGGGAVYRTVSPGFFAALRMPLVAGRLFDRDDGPGSQRVVVINRAMAAKYWPGENPLGQLVRARSMESGPNGAPAPWLTVIGIVGDVRTYGLESDARPEMYVYYRQTPAWRTFNMTLLVRGSGRASNLLPVIRRRAHLIDPHLAVDVGTLKDRLRNTLATRTLTMALLSGFAGMAVLLAALGVYGVLSYAVSRRTRELAVRAALGARPAQLIALVFRDGMRVVGVGVGLGVTAAFWLMRLLDSMLVDVKPIDPIAYLGALVVLFAMAFLAIVIPARRATRLDPLVALQAE